MAEQQGNRDQRNRYAHLVASKQVRTDETRVTIATESNTQIGQAEAQRANQNGTRTNQKAPPLGKRTQAYANNYYTSFSSVDLREQWIIMKDKILEKVEEPRSQRRLILFIVCCALLLDNMLYMVIVPIIPDYLRSIGAWSTYTENAKWIRRNVSGLPRWERVGGNVVYEGEDSAVGFLFASKAIVQLFINPFSGTIIDRIGYELPMMLGLTVMFFSTMVFACGQTYSVLFLARSLQGVGSAFADTSGLAMIADRFTEENERQRALGVALAFISFGCLVAPPFGAVLYQGAGKEVPFIILSLVCLLDGSLLLLVTPPGTFAQLLPGYQMQVQAQSQTTSLVEMNTSANSRRQPNGAPIELGRAEASDYQMSAKTSSAPAKRTIQRQKSISRRHSMTVASAGEAPKGTPIYVLFRDPCIACCSGALVVANVSLAFLEPTISIWMQNTMADIEEWQMGMIWLPAFVPHVLGVYSTVKLADKYPRYQWLIAAIGLILEGISCLMVPFCTSFWSLIIPISIICFGLALIDTAILPTLGFLVDTKYVSVYGSIYAIADISYSLSYAIGPVIAGGIVEAIGFTALNLLIALVTLGYTPILMMLRTIHDYEPFEADSPARRELEADAPSAGAGAAIANQESVVGGKYESPSWAASKPDERPAPAKKGSIRRTGSRVEGAAEGRRQCVKIVEAADRLCERSDSEQEVSERLQQADLGPTNPTNPFLAG